MKLITQSPKRALNKAFLKQRPLRSQIDLFKNELIALIDHIDDHESEEFHKNLVSDFLKKSIYQANNFINTKGRQDLVIHTGKDNKTQVGVIIEAKRPENKTDWFSPNNPNGKAIQELVLYYLRERIESNNIDIKYLIATNINEWYIIEASYFEKLFYRNKQFVKQYEEWRDGRKVTKDTFLFYNEIARPYIENLPDEIPCTYFNLNDYEKALRNDDPTDDKNLIALFKILSPYHLLKLPFSDDSNKLDEKFYKELLHIIGLEEVKDGSKNIIRRKKENKNPGSLLEMAIHKIKTKGIHKVPDLKSYGETSDEQFFNIALELCITWINRILFLKLLEGQLLSYHKGNKRYSFLNIETIQDFDELFKLFHDVLAVNIKDRETAIQKKYSHVPCLNSSLFEISGLEDLTISIDSLDNSEILDLVNTTVLKEHKKKNDKLVTLNYLFQFLDAYDFASEGTEDIQDDSRTLINASVLGKVFEKINGYKDGSFFTPGFITMYMCRKTIRLAVVQKFNESKKWNIKEFDELYNKIEDIHEANSIINDLKICDPAVGSGHFLVSALNEIIAIKSELKILKDKNGKRLKEYTIEVANDELIVTDEDADIFEYNPQNKESQRVQETLFTEKQTIIENCLFGVDINPNSVKICRLRLWIELLKNTFYKEESNFSELETLPNIDINIKCGNSLISRYALDSDLSKALRSINYNINAYRGFVNEYKNEKNHEVKRGLQIIIDGIKKDFRTQIFINDPKVIKLNKLQYEFNQLAAPSVFNEAVVVYGSEDNQKKANLRLKNKEAEINKLHAEIEEVRNNVIFKNAFEWRFEFPEILNNDGDFMGFDVVIGNPPYFSLSKIKSQATYFERSDFETYTKGTDIYCLFYEKGNRILKNNGVLAFITSNSWLKAIYGELLKKFFVKQMQPISLINIENTQVFEQATVESSIITLQKGTSTKPFLVCSMKADYVGGSSLNDYFKHNCFEFNRLNNNDWIIGDEKIGNLKYKIEQGSKILKEFDININRGFLTGLNEAFIINQETKNQLITENPKSAEIIKPILRGRDLKKYCYEFERFYLINSHNGLKSKKIERINVERDYHTIYKHLHSFLPKVEERQDKGNHWSNLRNCAYLSDFEKPKIIWGEISDKPKFAFDDSNFYAEATTFIMTGESLKYLLSILNSKISEWYFNQISTTTGMGTNRWKKYKIELLPIKDLSKELQEPFIKLVDQILESKKQGKDSSHLEKQIDEMVYKLYDLNEEEVKIVEG